jgi:hypothetical protein
VQQAASVWGAKWPSITVAEFSCHMAVPNTAARVQAEGPRRERVPHVAFENCGMGLRIIKVEG